MDTSLPRHLAPVFGPYANMPDHDAVACAQLGDKRAAECLLYRYRNLVKTTVRSFFIPGAEREDLLQIGMIGLWQAIVDFRCERSHSFPAFARVCVRRHLLTAIKSASRLKRLPLNASMPLEDTSPSRVHALAHVSPAAAATGDPETQLIWNEYVLNLQRDLRGLLSDFEWRVLADYKAGLSYHEIASRLGCKVKSVDNALARIRRKASVCNKQPAPVERTPCETLSRN